ncbi:succinylglutamate desuccinylase/aspartoacylase family protein [Lacinutrix sp. C3R15]|uniref:succinylglutamate desuccinylase/aspartoacylase family protein n=1 Tax=Flavobacteriaceae TaxID=49546 RepID=UPI001C084B91|nr:MULTISPECIES: succinylglutamate desuccinylase/aspartoacylase family protein [Flavobacteriaceae]MBU2938002.1 succinylglutamate desuccinylase/aspartoacylase family protein [Lacinutrix sp. C3R15]MDO6621316.1 succinylglutamate desuccinylase/aspartoacylase family protein [Oceanihabitans sp. 1_MG-2023]
MTLIKNKSITKTTIINRIIGKIQGVKKGPTIVFFAGIHGNEKAGVIALKKVFKEFSEETINGTVYGILGNLKALEKNQRYLDEDLNRIWTSEQLKNIPHKATLNAEEKEQKELFAVLHRIIENDSGPFYFIDFHTTSSKTLPFITINDAIINRKFSSQFPVPIVLGIEEYLNGPMLSYINELGYVSLGFESGQHEEKEAIVNCISFIYLTLAFTNAIDSSNSKDYTKYYNQLKVVSKKQDKVFEIVYLHTIKQDEIFKMKEGFKSFEDIKKKTVLATSNNQLIFSKYNAKIFMPLYQKKGKEGYFIIKEIAPFFLKLSTVLRSIKADNVLVILPGIFWENTNKNALIVNLKVTRFFAKSIFHLLGYRNKQADATHLKLYNRERVSKTEMYKDQQWY